MGGPGSGRWGGSPTCEDYHAVDVRHYARQGFLTPGASCCTRWYRGERETGSLGVVAGQDCLLLSYQVGSGGGQPTFVCQRIEMEYTFPHFGGQRPWFTCPQCGRRCAKLYGGSPFLCRQCRGLAYQSQREGQSGRELRRAQRIRERLGGAPSIALPFPPRPKGMHNKTYRKTRAEAEALEQAAWGTILRGVGHLLDGLGDSWL